MKLFGREVHPQMALHHLRLAWWALRGGGTALHRRVAASVLRDPSALEALGPYANEIPQARLDDRRAVTLEDRDWRQCFGRRFAGRGLEIGALHRPVPVPPGVRVDYVDRRTHVELQADYPELGPEQLVVPTVVTSAETLDGVADHAYDFLIAGHVIEHMRNPIGALASWARVVRPGGLIYLIVPEKRTTFDAHRVRTTLEHLILDAQRPSRERDYEHYLDWALHVHGKRCEEALADADRLFDADYSIHFHVFQPDDIVDLVEWCGRVVTPMHVAEGPVASPSDDEFHVLVRTGSSAPGRFAAESGV